MKTGWDKLWIGFGILTIISGIYLVTQEDYLIGFSGSCVGVWLVAMNMKQATDETSE